MVDFILIAQAGGADPVAELFSMLVPLGIVFVIFYLLIIRPEGKKRREHLRFLDALKVGDEVVTTGGLVGKITAVDDATVKVRVSKNTTVDILRSSIQGSKDALMSRERGEEEKSSDS